MASIWHNSEVVVACEAEATVVGFAVLYDIDYRNQIGYLAALSADLSSGSGAVLGGTALLVEYGFRHLPIRRIYIDCDARALVQYQSVLVAEIAVEEARFRDYYLESEGRRHDRVVLTIDRERWLSNKLARRLVDGAIE